MCRQITWYHIVCSHQTDSYNIPILCKKAVNLGYECYPPECILLPIFGNCSQCKHPKNLIKNGPGCKKPSSETKGRQHKHDRLSLPESLPPLEEEIESGCDTVGDDSAISVGYEGEDEPDKKYELFDKVTF